MPAEQGKSKRRPPPVETRFKPGQSGNPTGRRKGSGIIGLLHQALTPERKKAIVNRVVTMAAAGDLRALELILDRLDGPVSRDLNVTLDAAQAFARLLSGDPPNDGDR